MALILERKSRSCFHIRIHIGSSYDYMTDVKYKYCGEKGHYKKECRTKKKDKKSRKLQKTFQKEQANIIDKKDQKDDESVFVAALSVTMSDKEWYINFGTSYYITRNQSRFLSYENL